LLTAAGRAGVLEKVEALVEGEQLLVGGEVRAAAASDRVTAGRAGSEVYSVR
jgi:hypothetical protein